MISVELHKTYSVSCPTGPGRQLGSVKGRMPYATSLEIGSVEKLLMTARCAGRVD
jgi:hypothetical protein